MKPLTLAKKMGKIKSFLKKRGWRKAEREGKRAKIKKTKLKLESKKRWTVD